MKRIIYPGWAVPVELYRPYKPDDMLDYGFFTGTDSEATALDINFDELNDLFLEKLIPNEPCMLIAHSLGSLLALRSSQLSENIKAVVLVSGFARFLEADDYPAGKPLSAVVMMSSMMNMSSKMVLDKFYQGMTAPSTFEVNPEGKADVKRLQGGLKYLEDTDLREQLKDINVPVMIIQGEKDQIVDAKLAEYLSENIPNSILELIPDAGHALPFTHTQECLNLIDGFIA